MTDEALLDMIRRPAGREDGFRQLVIKYQRKLYDVIRQRLAYHEDADDVLQNTFLKIFRNIQAFEGRSELFTWMYRIACNEVINYQKQNKRAKTFELDVNDLRKADAYINTDHVSKNLEDAVSRLPERQQMVFRMRYYDDLSYKQIGELLRISEGALKASFHHAVKKIEEEFKARQII